MKKYLRIRRIKFIIISFILTCIILLSLGGYLIRESFDLTIYIYTSLFIYLLFLIILINELLGKIKISDEYFVIYFLIKANYSNKQLLIFKPWGIKINYHEVDCLYISSHCGTYLDPGDYFQFKIVFKSGVSYEGDFHSFGSRVERRILEHLKQCSNLIIHF